jgi:hypothetical protein
VRRRLQLTGARARARNTITIDASLHYSPMPTMTAKLRLPQSAPIMKMLHDMLGMTTGSVVVLGGPSNVENSVVVCVVVEGIGDSTFLRCN